jgi:hypothetical protein
VIRDIGDGTDTQTGAIVGGVVGGAGLCVLCGALYWCTHKRNTAAESTTGDATKGAKADPNFAPNAVVPSPVAAANITSPSPTPVAGSGGTSPLLSGGGGFSAAGGGGHALLDSGVELQSAAPGGGGHTVVAVDIAPDSHAAGANSTFVVPTSASPRQSVKWQFSS